MIRVATVKDAKDIKGIHTLAIDGLNSFYTQEQIAVWTSGDDDDMSSVIEHSPYFIVIEIQDKIVGFAGLRDDLSLRHLYIHPDHQKRGLGRELLLHIENYLKQNNNREISLEANKSCVGFYQNIGYSIQESKNIKISDQEIYITKMIKTL